MPIELSPDAVERVMARLGEHDLDAPRDVEGALEWICSGEGPAAPVTINRYALQVFLWYQLPRKWLTSREHKRAVAARLGRFLELVGGRAATYGEICMSEETSRLLEAWEDEDGGAGALFRHALDASGLEPPDTDALEWGSVMGLEEARLRDEAALELERALEDGRLEPGERGFKRRQAELVTGFLRSPRAELDGRSPIDLVAQERLEGWARRGSEERRAIVAAVELQLRQLGPAGKRPPADAGALEPLCWLLDAVVDGIALTQTGALNRALVRAAVERFPDWWDAELFGPPHREGEVFSLCEVHELARRMRLLRRRGRKLVLTTRGKALRGDRAALLHACAPDLLAADGFEAAAQELAAAVLLSRESVDRGKMDAAVHAAIVADGWTADGEAPRVEDVAGAAAGLIRLTDALGLVDYEYEYDREAGLARRDLTPAPAGREALRLALRSRAVAPARLA